MNDSASPPPLPRLEERFVSPFYLSFLHANYVHEGFLFKTTSERDGFRAAAKQAAREVSTVELGELLRLGDWRPRLAAGYLLGIGHRAELAPVVAQAIVEFRYGFATQGYVFALVRLGASEARTALEAFVLAAQDVDDREIPLALAALSLLHGEVIGELQEDVARQRTRLEAELRFWDG